MSEIVGERGERGTKWVRERVAVIRWCYLGAGRCVWHNLKLEIAVSISPHSVATRSTDNKSSLILLKISRECSGGWDEDSKAEEETLWGRGQIQGRERRGRRPDWLKKQNARIQKKKKNISPEVLLWKESFTRLLLYRFTPSAHHSTNLSISANHHTPSI